MIYMWKYELPNNKANEGMKSETIF